LKEEKRILRIAAFVFIIAILTKGLQIIFFPLVATFFGISRELESFIVAYSIPTFVSTVLFGNFGAAFILIFTQQKLKHGEGSAWEFASSMINIFFLGAIAISAAGVWLSPWIIRLMVPGMESAYKDIGTTLTQILFVTVIFFTSIMMLTALLQSYQSFILPATATLLSNFVLIGTILIVKQRIGVYVLAVAIILSEAFAVALLLRGSKGIWRNRYTFKINVNQWVIKDAMLMFVGLSIIGSLWQINLITNRFFASFLSIGSIATLEYASRSVLLIVELLSLSVVSPLYQRMSMESAIEDKAKVRDTFSLGLKMTAVVLLPIAAFVIFLRFPIFQIFLEHGEFTTQNTAQVSSVFLYLSLSLIGGGFGQMIAGAYCVLRKVRLLLTLSLCGLILNILLSAILHKIMGVEGLALATGISTLLVCLFSLGVLNKEIGGLDVIYLAKFMVKTSLGAILSGALGWLLFLYMGHLMKVNLLSQTMRVGVSAVVWIVMYILMMSLFRMGEISLVLNLVKERFKFPR
jgi:putative peptidoglycan lipid II flippase